MKTNKSRISWLFFLLVENLISLKRDLIIIFIFFVFGGVGFHILIGTLSGIRNNSSHDIESKEVEGSNTENKLFIIYKVLSFFLFFLLLKK